MRNPINLTELVELSDEQAAAVVDAIQRVESAMTDELGDAIVGTGSGEYRIFFIPG